MNTEQQSERPKIKDFFPTDTNIQAVNDAYYNNKELFNYCQALDNYIDGIEKNTINEPIKDEELLQQFGKLFQNEDITMPISRKCVEIAKQYSASQVNKSAIKDNRFIKDEELKGKFDKIFYDYRFKKYVGLKDSINLCIKTSQQYAVSQVNNTVEDKWISVEKELPEIDEYALWLAEDGNMHVIELDKDGNEWLYGKNKYGFKLPKITHWQPLPNPPIK